MKNQENSMEISKQYLTKVKIGFFSTIQSLGEINNTSKLHITLLCNYYHKSMLSKIAESARPIKLCLQDLRRQIIASTAEKLLKNQKQFTKQLKKISVFVDNLNNLKYIHRHQSAQNSKDPKQTPEIPLSDSNHDEQSNKIPQHPDRKLQIYNKHNVDGDRNEISLELELQLNSILKLIELKLLTSFIPKYYFAFFNRLFHQLKNTKFSQVVFIPSSDVFTQAERSIKLSSQAKNHEQNTLIQKVISNCIDTQKYYHLIETKQQDMNEILINQQYINDNEQLIPNPIFSTMRCWKCLTHLQKNSLLLEEDSSSKYMNFCLGEKPSFSAFTTFGIQDANKRDPVLLGLLSRVLNVGGGFIYFGIQEVKQKNIKPIKKQLGDTNNLLEKFICLKKKQLIRYERKQFVVQGVKINQKTSTHKNNVRAMIKQYIANGIGPEKMIEQTQVYISYLPVLPSYKNFKIKKNSEKGRYVIRAQVKFKQTNRLYYVKSGNKIQAYNFYGDDQDMGEFSKKCSEESQDPMNKLYGSDIYKLMVKKNKKFLKVNKKQKSERVGLDISIVNWQQNYGQNCKDCNYPIRCYLPLHLPDHEYNQTSYNNQIDPVQENASNETSFYYKTPDQYSKMAETFNKKLNLDQQPNKKQSTYYMKNLFPKKKLNINCNPTIFGTVPVTKKFNHTSIVIVSPKGKELELFEKFMDQLTQRKIYNTVTEEPYDKLPKKSVREVYVINHAVKYQILNQIGRKIDHQKRNLVVLDVRKQMMIMSSQNYPKAIPLLTSRFKQVFNSNFRTALKDVKSKKGIDKIETQHYFAFDDEPQAIFAFILLEYEIIKCDFVNQIKLAGLFFNQY